MDCTWITEISDSCRNEVFGMVSFVEKEKKRKKSYTLEVKFNSCLAWPSLVYIDRKIPRMNFRFCCII